MNEHVRLNLGCGMYPLRGWINLDSDPGSGADVFAELPPIPYADGVADEIYMGHFFEHLDRPTATELLAECRRVLRRGGKLGVVVPDTREVMRRWLDGPRTRFEVPAGMHWRTDDLDAICSVFLYSTIQDTPHKWSYDLDTLGRALVAGGFALTREIDRQGDPRIVVGAWYQCGWDAVKR